jgi:hypothetical protein
MLYDDNLYTSTWITHVLEVDNFWFQKKGLQDTNMGSSFEDLIVTNPTRKCIINHTNHLSYETFWIVDYTFNVDDINIFVFSTYMFH